MALFTEDSDEDSVATDTTEESVHSADHDYNVEEILAEDYNQEGKKVYLVKWEGYALHRATWEPRACFDTDDQINQFKARKRAAEKGGPPMFDVIEHEEALEVAGEERQSRAQRRTAKRKKRREPRKQTSAKGTDALPTTTSRKNLQACPVRKKGVAQKVVKTRQGAISAARSTSGESASRVRAPKVAEPAKTTERPKTTEPAKKAEPAKTAESSKMGAPETGTKPKAVSKSVPAAQSAAPAEWATIQKPTAPTGTPKATPAASTAKSTQPARNTALLKALLGTDVPEYKRKQKPRITEETPKDSSSPKFRTLSEQNRYQKYSRNEPAPNINAVPLLDPSTGKALPDELQPALSRKDNAPQTPIADSVAREKTNRRRSLSHSPTALSDETLGQVRDTVTKPVQAGPADDSNTFASGRRNSVAQTAASKASASLPPQSIFALSAPTPGPSITKTTPSMTSDSHNVDSQSARGRRTPSLERRQQFPSPPIVRPDNQVGNHALAGLPLNDPKRTELNKRYTCYHWKNGNGCYKSAEQCNFSHHDTGRIAPGPGQQTCFYWRMYGECSKTQAQCKYAHVDTGVYAPVPFNHVNKGSGNGQDVVMPTASHLQGAASHPRENGTSNDLFRSLSGCASESYGMPVQSGMEDGLHGMSQSVPDRFLHVHMQDSRSIDEDLELAKKSIQTLSATKFLSRNGKRIEDVYLLMPPERDGERQLLTDFFKAFHCEVFDSNTPQHWDLFKSLSSGLVVVHPKETFDGTIPGFAKYLQLKGWVFSIGVREDWGDFEHDQPILKYEARRVFPHGGITFISDDVFEYYPEQATKIIKEFHKSSKRKPAGSETSKIGARPGVRDWLARLAQRKMEEGGEDYEDDRYVNCWDAICELCPLEDYDPYEMAMGNMIPKDDALLWSVAEQDLPSFQGLWEKDQARATDMMANLFAGTGVERMADFQRLCFIYQRPDQPAMNDEVPASQLAPQVGMDQVDPKGWMQKYNHIEVMTPDAWLAMTRKRAEH